MVNRVKHILMQNDGTILIEYVIAIAFLSMASMMIITTMSGATKLFFDSYAEYDRVNDLYGDIELLGDSLTSSDLDIRTSGTIEFDYSVGTISKEGAYYYDNTEKKIGEFIID